MTEPSAADLEGTAASCAHCGNAVPEGAPDDARFCCPGCAAAHAIIGHLGLDQYYRRRVLDPAVRPLVPDDDAPAVDCSPQVRAGEDGIDEIHLMVDGLHCAACVWLIESVLAREPGVIWARVNFGSRRLTIRWRHDEADPNVLVRRVAALGYRLVPYDPAQLSDSVAVEERTLLRALAVAGFAAGNIMLLSVAVWAGHAQDMGEAARTLLHWVSAVIAIPTVAYAGRPFFRSGLAALSARRLNMDVPISLAVTLALAMSLFETLQGGAHVYFDSAVTLLFFLLIGRYLASRARGRARSAAEHLLALRARSVTVLADDGTQTLMPPDRVAKGATVLVAAGERVGVDGRIRDGESLVDSSLISGESLPRTLRCNDPVFAGMVNLGEPMRITVTASGEDTLLSEIVRMMETAEQERAGYVTLADRVARLYAPVVHGLALATFIGWVAILGTDWQPALLNAIAVLIITCPCALALAVPAVQVIASGRLLRRGVLLKSATALERLANADAVVFDKTGTLTRGRLLLNRDAEIDPDALACAAALCAVSRHPLARALCAAAPPVAVAEGVREVPGAGLALDTPAGEIRVGSRAFCGVPDDGTGTETEIWLVRPDREPVRFTFADALRDDAAATVAAIREDGYHVALLSGDRQGPVEAAAGEVGIDDRQAEARPDGKLTFLRRKAEEGRHVLLVGDGLNDAPALAAAHVSLSPASGADISQAAADAVFQGERLAPVLEALDVARVAGRLVRQNIGFTFLYNAVTIPLAVCGLITPLIAAIAMSASSLVVVGNALRLDRVSGRRRGLIEAGAQ